jgi:hypothetical protein
MTDWRDEIPKTRAWLVGMTRYGEDAVWRGAERAVKVLDALLVQNNAYRTLNAHLEAEIARHRADAHKYHAAITTLDSEREANALLTAEIERLNSLPAGSCSGAGA